MHDVCVYISPLARVAGEPAVLEFIDLDASREAPHLACEAAFLLLEERERELFDPVLSGLKGLKLVSLFYLPLELHGPFLIWLERKQKRAKIQDLGVKIDFNPLKQHLNIDNPPQPVRLWGFRGKNNTPRGEAAPWVAARPARWEEVARIGLEGADAYRRAVARKPSGEEIALWTEAWAARLRPAPPWLIKELYEIEQETELAKSKQDVNFPARRSEKRISFYVLCAYLSEQGYNFKIKNDYTIVFSFCPVCKRRHKAWINLRKHKLFCFSPNCSAHKGIDLATFLPDLSFPETKNEKEEQKKLSLIEAIELTDKTIASFFAGKVKKVLVAADPGVGKTYAAFRHAIDAAVQGNVTPIISLPTYEECKEKIREHAEYALAKGVRLQLLKSRHQAGMCENLDEVVLVEKLGYNPAAVVCPFCADRKECSFFRQFESVSNKNTVFVTTHHFLPSALVYLKRADWRNFKLVVDDLSEQTYVNSYSILLDDILNFCEKSRFFDEEIFDELAELANKLPRPQKRSKKWTNTLTRVYNKPAESGELSKFPSLCGLGVELDIAKLKESVKDFINTYPKQRQRIGYYLTLECGNEIILRALEKIADDGRWWLEKDKRGRVYIRWEEVTKFDEYDVCLLSATPDVPSLKKIFGEFEILEAKVEGLEKALRIHIRKWYRKSIKDFKKYVPALIEAFKKLKYAGKKKVRVLVIAHLKNKKPAAAVVREALRKAGLEFELYWKDAHHFNLKGSNAYEHCNIVVMFGSPTPNPVQLHDLAYAFELNEAETIDYISSFSKREAEQEIHRLRLTRANYGEKAVIYVGSEWPFDVEPEVVIFQTGRPRKGTSYSPVKVEYIETKYDVIKPLVAWRRKLANTYLAITAFSALPSADEGGKQQNTAILPKILSLEDEDGLPPP